MDNRSNTDVSLRMNNFREARALLLGKIKPAGTRVVDLSEAAFLVAARDYAADRPVPGFARAAFDGYAMRSADLKGAAERPVTLAVVREIRAGGEAGAPLGAGQAVKIMTGAPVPANADCVIMREKTTFSQGSVTVGEELKAGANVVVPGEDQPAGALIVGLGERIGAAAAGMLASQGIDKADVYKKPRVALISTGEEIAEPGTPLPPGGIYNSNRFTLEAELRRMGCDPYYLGAAKDDVLAIAAKIGTGLGTCDAVILTGGVSAGEYDLVPAAMARAGAEILVRGIRMKPGMACCYAMRAGKICIGLSGNPAAALTNFHAVAKPLLRKLAGEAKPEPETFSVVMLDDFPKAGKSERLLRGKLSIGNGICGMSLDPAQGNAVIRTFAGADALAVVPEDHGPVAKGDVLEAFLI